MSWLIPDDSLDKDTVAEMFLKGWLACVDNVFRLTRLFNGFDRLTERRAGRTRSGMDTILISPR